MTLSYRGCNASRDHPELDDAIRWSRAAYKGGEMLASGSHGAPNGLAAFEQALAEAHYPFEVAEVDASGSFEWTMETHYFGQLPISRGRSDLSYRGRRRRHEQASDHFVLHMTERGSVRFAEPNNSITTDAGAVVLLHPDLSLETEKLGRVDALALAIPASLLTRHFPEADRWGISVRSSRLGSAAVLRDLVLSCWSQRQSVSPGDAIHLNKALINLVGATFGASNLERFKCASPSNRRRFEKIQDIVIENLQSEELSADFVASKLGISKSHMFAVVKEAGTTLGRFILEQRLERARQLLADPDLTNVFISEIAYYAGFRGMPHFSRCFTQHYGESPRAFRVARRALSS